MRIDIVTLFPAMFAALNYGILGRAQKHGLIELHYWNPRDFTRDKHHTVDDRPYGGGPGMVMKIEPLHDAIQAAHTAHSLATVISYLSPQGKVFDQAAAQVLSQRPRLLLIAGRYEGIDERLMQINPGEEWSLGDFVLSGGELAAMCMIDSVVRLLPGALGDADSARQDSFTDKLLDHPHYTRPELWQNLKVPQTLLSGNHEVIRRWRLQQALGRTWLRRPDLIKKRVLTEEERVLLTAFIKSQTNESV